MLMCALSLPGAAVQALDASVIQFFKGLPAWSYPVAIAAVLVLVALIMKLRALPSHLRGRHKSTLDPIQLEELMAGAPPQIVDLRPRED